MVLTEDMKWVAREQRLGFAATVCPDGTPNSPPKGTTAVVEPIARRGYRLEGHATVVDGGELFDQILAFCETGDAPVTDAGTRIRSAVLVSLERELPLVSPAYDLGRTEDAIRAARWSPHAALQNRPPEERAAPAAAGRSAGPSPS